MPDDTNSIETVLYMLRHGEPSEDNHGRFYGQSDVPLSERGVRQSHALVDRLAAVPFDAVYSSDLQRSAFLADLLGERIGLPVRRSALFRERSLGVFQGLTEDEMRERDPELFAAWKADRLLQPVAEGETFADLAARVVPAVRELVFNFPGWRIALACHAGPIRVTLADALGMPLERALNFALDYGCVNVIEFPAGGSPRVKLVNG